MAYSKAAMIAQMRTFMDPGHGSFVAFPTSASDFATKMTAAYDAGASTATDQSGDAIAGGTSTATMESTLAALGDDETVADAAAAWAQAWEDYWATGAGVTFLTAALLSPSPPCPNEAGPHNGIWALEITSALDSIDHSNLESDLVTIFTDNDVGTSADSKINAIADAFEAATLADISIRIDGLDTTPPMSGGPFPIANICQLT